MKYDDWYVAAVFVLILWVVAVGALWFMFTPALAGGMPLAVAEHTIGIITTWMLMLAAVFAGIGACEALIESRKVAA